MTSHGLHPEEAYQNNDMSKGHSKSKQNSAAGPKMVTKFETKSVFGDIENGKFCEHLDFAVGKGWVIHGSVAHLVKKVDGEDRIFGAALLCKTYQVPA